MHRLAIAALVIIFTLSACQLALPGSGERQEAQTASLPITAGDGEAMEALSETAQAMQGATQLAADPMQGTATAAVAGLMADLPAAGMAPELQASGTVTPTATPPAPASWPRFALQSGSPNRLSNFLHPEVSCNWSGIGGQVFGKDGNPVTGLVARVEGVLGGEPVLLLALTGGSTNLGPGGYEIAIAEKLVASEAPLSLQLFDLQGNPASQKVLFNSTPNCEENMVLMNFAEQPQPKAFFYLPLLVNEIPGKGFYQYLPHAPSGGDNATP